LAPAHVLDKFFGDAIGDRLTFRDDGDEIAAWHGLSGILDRVVETESLFAALDANLTVIDIAATRGSEEIVDLNVEIPDRFAAAFDVVVDPGTIEHCFNIARAVANTASCVRQGGFIVHYNPMNMFNHGFYNLNPTFYTDFYAANGFRLIGQLGIEGPLTGQKTFPIETTARFAMAPVDSYNLVIAERETVGPIIWPMQTKYRLQQDAAG
jgi:SAM-dependent methyltransferase